MGLFMRKVIGKLLKDSVWMNTLYNLMYKVKNKKSFFAIQENRKNMSIFNCKDLAAPIPYYPLEFVKDSNYYGQNFWIKKYTGLQHIDVSIEHGLYYGDYIPYSSYCKTVKKILTFSLVRKQVLEKLNKPVVTIGPYIHYVPYLLAESEVQAIREKYGRILLFLPTHTTREGGRKYDAETNVGMLKAFAKENGFTSVFVCMYYYDILHSDLATVYEQAGFNVVTAGHRLDLNFLCRLKSIIGLADYTISNFVGTHVGYCIYLKKPHWIMNPVDFSGMPKDFVEITEAFLSFSNTITQEQYDVVAKYWGFDQLKTLEDLRELLYS